MIGKSHIKHLSLKITDLFVKNSSVIQLLSIIGASKLTSLELPGT